MKILAIDSSSMVATVAVVEDDKLIAEYTTNHGRTHSQTLLPMIDEMKKSTELDLSTLDAIAIAGGPGSYTGLRIGSATAKGLALALDIPIINVPTLDAMAYNMYTSQCVVCPMMDARRDQVYTGIYQFDEFTMETKLSQRIMMIDEVVEKLNDIGKEVILLGDGAVAHKEYIDGHLEFDHKFAPPSMNMAKASSLAALAKTYYKKGKVETADEHKPNYLRASQAERELKEKKK